jgi:hypothetical protein
MIENTAENRITEIVQAWNDVTKQTMNPRRFCMSGEIMHFVIDGEVTAEEMTLVARYMVATNRQASEARFVKPLDLYRVMSNIAKFEATVQLARAYFRNQVKPTAKAAFIQSIPIGCQTHGILPADAGNTKTARDVGASLAKEMLKQFEKQ